MQLQDATFDTAGQYDCEVTVLTLPGLLTSGSVHIIVQGEEERIKCFKLLKLSERALNIEINLLLDLFLQARLR